MSSAQQPHMLHIAQMETVSITAESSLGQPWASLVSSASGRQDTVLVLNFISHSSIRK